MTTLFTVAATCCGSVHVPVSDISVLDFDDVLTYSYRCPNCKGLVVTGCQEPLRRILMDSGAWWTHQNSVLVSRLSPQEKWTVDATERIRRAIHGIDHPSNGEKP